MHFLLSVVVVVVVDLVVVAFSYDWAPLVNFSRVQAWQVSGRHRVRPHQTKGCIVVGCRGIVLVLLRGTARATKHVMGVHVTCTASRHACI